MREKIEEKTFCTSETRMGRSPQKPQLKKTNVAFLFVIFNIYPFGKQSSMCATHGQKCPSAVGWSSTKV